jgi:hypothetical protein
MVEFAKILASLDEKKRRAVQEQCGDWQTFLVMDQMTWEGAKRNIIDEVKLAATATKLDVLWKELHPSQSTGLSHRASYTDHVYTGVHELYLISYGMRMTSNNHRMS